MCKMGLAGEVRGKKVRITTPEDDVFCPTDLRVLRKSSGRF
ncbi:hypothetical protein X474_07465 [Dethiosulfatarculus sandiegensis]|uniref:Uncharacterized protein n=2 Tax=Dethiosulfatarculus sandiegensis TaxID=1429043 RepID=A0A0D2GIT0_9BACT|nr:hypothetical protein X474_07465 [Dethiosulfatarculus sandiegensis]